MNRPQPRISLASAARVRQIQLAPLLTDKVLAANPASILASSARRSSLVDFAGVPSYKIRTKFHRAILARGDNPLGLYGILEPVFTEAAIKSLFKVPDVWLLNHNARAKKRRAGEKCELNRLRRLDPAAAALHAQCVARLRNRSASAAMRDTNRLSARPKEPLS